MKPMAIRDPAGAGEHGRALPGDRESLKLDYRWIRLRAVWLLILPFLYFARPTVTTLIAGGALALAGALIRGWAAGFLRKNQRLATSGPYAFTRNPLYLGSFLIGLGVTIAGNVVAFVVLFVLFFLGIYLRVARREARFLEEKFGDEFRRWAQDVPLFLPRPTPWRGAPEGEEDAGAFAMDQYRRNREYEAVIGLVAGFAFLTFKMMWMGS
jgi:protein-S-isoprenylcysteine O-methyltransferase Ste14